MKIKLLLLFCLISAQIFSQDKFSFDSELSKNFHDSEKWKIDATLSLKELYSEADWQRWGLSGVVAHKRGVFTPKGGLAVYYTFDKYVVSKWELRPWVGVALRNKVAERLYLVQEVRAEWRNVFEVNRQYSGSGRTRYKLGWDYQFRTSENATTKVWGLTTYAKWYFIKKDGFEERFNNSKEYGIIATKGITPKMVLHFGYKHETLYNSINAHTETAHSIAVGVRL